MTDVALIGPGRVGTALALALPESYRVLAVAGGHGGGAKAFQARFPLADVVPTAEAARRAELVLLCVPDDVVAAVARQVAAEDGVAEGSRWVHTAGGLGTEALRAVRSAGGRVAACHPAQTFPDADTGRLALPGAAWAVTAGHEDLAWARALVADLGGRPFTVAEPNRVLYHAALAFGANGTSVLVAQARELLRGAGIEDPAAFLTPLVRAAAGNAALRGAAALTGPVRRGDAGTVGRHLDELTTTLPEAVEVYVALARLALRQAVRAGLDPERAAAVAAALEDVPQ